ncbi:transporter [Massilia sp. TWP1-3-3]|uniref:transporter n=1 Tax=Massilia sp. TWP1-3-3 TaxID=2804573 RepID=UPI003CFAE196
MFAAIARPHHPALPPLLLFLAALGPHTAFAADGDSITTDRPNFVESSNVVGAGRVQLETSIGIDRSKVDGVREHTIATPTLLRFGVSDTVELRVETDGAMRSRTTDGSSPRQSKRGYGDVSLGLKWHAVDAAGALPSLGLLFHADLDTGSAPFRGQGTRPSARIVAEWELGAGMSLGVMPGFVYERHAGGTHGILGVVVGKA